jgi:uncharacterized repeat protein (TIGR03806 family)
VTADSDNATGNSGAKGEANGSGASGGAASGSGASGPDASNANGISTMDASTRDAALPEGGASGGGDTGGTGDDNSGADANTGGPTGGTGDDNSGADANTGGPTGGDVLGPSGLDARPSNTTCLAKPRPVPQGGTVSRTDLAPGVTNFPTAITDMKRAPAGVGAWLGIDFKGELFALADGATNVQRNVIDKSWLTGFKDPEFGGEEGLLGLAVDPDYPNAAAPNVVRVFLYFSSTTCNAGQPQCSRLRRFDLSFQGTGASRTFSADTNKTCASSSRCRDLFVINQPAPNHNGGAMQFGPDGYLYISFGDGGYGGACNSQNRTTPHGKIFRIDVHSNATPYGIPPSNPYANETALCNQHAVTGDNAQIDQTRSTPCPEIVAAGLRNPFRMSFDRATGRLWIGDVGAETYEEADSFMPSALSQGTAPPNFGWPRREGPATFSAQDGYCATVVSSGREVSSSYIAPHAYFDHRSSHTLIVGGYVYRGTALGSTYLGSYFLADVTGDMWIVPNPAAQNLLNLDTSSVDTQVSSFGDLVYGFAEDDAGELVLFGPKSSNNRPQKLILSGGSSGSFPQTLQETGCFSASGVPTAGLIKYEVNAPLWSDDAEKERYFAIPNGTTIARTGSEGDFDLPIGSVVAKVFRRNGKLLETRLLMRHSDGDWAGYTYVWNSAGTQATLAGEGETVLADRSWTAPSRTQCMQCHTSAAGRTLSLEVAQLNRDFTYPETGRTANQLETYSQVGLLSQALTSSAQGLARLAPPTGMDALGARARAYLHSNCGNCHRPSGGTPSAMDLRYTTALHQANVCNVMPASGSWPSAMRLISLGSATNSLVAHRPKQTSTARMPPLGSVIVDGAGTGVVDAWINALSTCQ